MALVSNKNDVRLSLRGLNGRRVVEAFFKKGLLIILNGALNFFFGSFSLINNDVFFVIEIAVENDDGPLLILNGHTADNEAFFFA